MSGDLTSKQAANTITCETQGHLWSADRCIMCHAPKPRAQPPEAQTSKERVCKTCGHPTDAHRGFTCPDTDLVAELRDVCRLLPLEIAGRAADAIDRLRALAYMQLPVAPFSVDGWTWRQAYENHRLAVKTYLQGVARAPDIEGMRSLVNTAISMLGDPIESHEPVAPASKEQLRDCGYAVGWVEDGRIEMVPRDVTPEDAPDLIRWSDQNYPHHGPHRLYRVFAEEVQS